SRRRAAAPRRGRPLAASGTHAILPHSCASPSTLESASAESGPAVSESVCASAERPVTETRATNCRPAFHETGRFFFARRRILTPRSQRAQARRRPQTQRNIMTIEVGILGATGQVGQQFIALLASHPWFKVTWLGASERAAGKAYRDATAWRLPSPLPDEVANLSVNAAAPGGAPQLVFSGLDSSVAGEIEGAFARAGHLVVSNSRNYRMERDVPLLIPEVNATHLGLLPCQKMRGWQGRIVANT